MTYSPTPWSTRSNPDGSCSIFDHNAVIIGVLREARDGDCLLNMQNGIDEKIIELEEDLKEKDDEMKKLDDRIDDLEEQLRLAS